LRHYEKLALLVPARVEPGNRYRYYSGDQVAILKDIILMKELGLSLRMIKQMIDRRGWPGEVATMLEKHRNRLLRQVRLCNYRLQKLERRENIIKIKLFREAVRYETVIEIVPGTPRRRVQVLVPKKHRYSLAGHAL